MEAVVVWLKLIHIAAILVWSAGLFYMPGLFAIHTTVNSGLELRRLRAMTRFAYVVVSSPAAVIAIVSGTALIYFTGVHGLWLAMKLTAVALMMLFHVACGRMLAILYERPRLISARTHLWLMIVPAILIPVVLWLVLAKPG